MTRSSTSRVLWEAIHRATGEMETLARSTHFGGAHVNCPKTIPNKLENKENNHRKGRQMLLPIRETADNILLFKSFPYHVLHLVVFLDFIMWKFFFAQ